MPFQYVRDDDRHRIRITLSDPLTVAELTASIERQFADGAWLYGLIVDARSVVAQPIDIPSFQAHVRELVATHGPRGPVAFVATESGVIGSAQRYIFGSKSESMEVFWALDDAQRWMDERMA
jgi:hypothetical protein